MLIFGERAPPEHLDTALLNGGHRAVVINDADMTGGHTSLPIIFDLVAATPALQDVAVGKPHASRSYRPEAFLAWVRYHPM